MPAAQRARDGRAAGHGRADHHRADGDGAARARRAGRVAHRRAGGHRHRRRSHQGQDRTTSRRSTSTNCSTQGNVVIVAGFQGETPEGQITTLGAAVGSHAPSRSPRRSRPTSARFTPTWTAFIPPTRASCPTRRKLAEISYDEMLELAALGAKVMQARSVEFAKKFGVVFEVRSSLNDNPGTIVKEETQNGRRRHPRRLARQEPGQSHARRRAGQTRRGRASSRPSPTPTSTST